MLWFWYWLIALAVFWCVCGVLAYGYTYAFYQREFPRIAYKARRYDRRLALLAAVLGPIGLVAAAAGGQLKHGVKWW